LFLRGGKQEGNGEDCIMRSFMICTYQILFTNEMGGAGDLCRREERGVRGFIDRTLGKETTLKT